MPPTHHNYSPANILVSFRGVNITGFADGTFVNAARNEDSYSLVAGSHGDSVFVRNLNRTGLVTLTLMQSSPSNDFLSSQIAADELFGLGEGPLFIKDLNGNTLVEDQNARLMKPADSPFGKDLENREWQFGCPQMSIFTGGAIL